MVEMRQQLAVSNGWTGAATARLERRAPPTMRPAAARLEGSPLLLSTLAATLRDEVLPRLVLAHRAMTVVATPLPQATAAADVWSDVVIELTRLTTGRDSRHVAAFVDALAANGTSIETIYLDVLAPTARRLGVLWTEDVYDIADVTLGLWRLNEVRRALSPAFLDEAPAQNHGRSVLLVPAPGETHSFGLAMVSDFFARAGWNVAGGPATAGQDLGDWVRRTWFAVVGFSVGCDASLDVLAAAIRLVRRSSRNRAVGVMVGGPIFAMRPELAQQVGADATATDGRRAVDQARNLVGLLAAR